LKIYEPSRPTLKKSRVDPKAKVPYLIFVCLAKSSTENIIIHKN